MKATYQAAVPREIYEHVDAARKALSRFQKSRRWSPAKEQKLVELWFQLNDIASELYDSKHFGVKEQER